MLPEHVIQKIQLEMKKYPSRRSALVGALHAAQQEYGYLSPEVVGEVAGLFDFDPNALNELVTFYSMLYREPVGKYVLGVCDSLTCYLVGSDRTIDYLSQLLEVSVGGTTPDGLFTLQRAECLAACEAGPVMLVNDIHHENLIYHGNLTPERLEAIVQDLRSQAAKDNA